MKRSEFKREPSYPVSIHDIMRHIRQMEGDAKPAYERVILRQVESELERILDNLIRESVWETAVKIKESLKILRELKRTEETDGCYNPFNKTHPAIAEAVHKVYEILKSLKPEKEK